MSCSSSDCCSPVQARGMCNLHYKRWRKSGGQTRRRTTHGESRNSVEYVIWRNMSREPEGRCVSWSSFSRFVEDMGRRNGKSILARKDTRLPFGPYNCFWSLSNKNSESSRMRISETKRERIVVDGVVLFKCGGECGRFLSVSDFYKLAGNINGIRSRCKVCHSSLAIRTRDVNKWRDRKRRHEARRRAWKAGTKIVMTRDQEIDLERLWGSCCVRCGSVEDLTWDHIVPLSLGGSHCVTNLQRMCRSENEKKHTSVTDYRSATQIEWAKRIIREAA